MDEEQFTLEMEAPPEYTIQMGGDTYTLWMEPEEAYVLEME